MSVSVQQLLSPRPFLKWAGGKSRLISQYQPYFPTQFSGYYEPFLGGGAIYFHLQPHWAVLSDINPELVNVYRCIRDDVEGAIALLEHHAHNHSYSYYYQVRALQPQDPIARAARFIYLNRTCFNGLYRENSQGQFNVPLGRYKNPKICYPELLKTASLALKNTEIQEMPFEQILDLKIAQNAFVYFDPPYHPLSSTSNFTAYSRHDFKQEDQERLRDIFATLAKRGVQVMLSNSDCPFIRELYQDFFIHPIFANRSINSNHQKRGKIGELLITSYPIAC
ncbi:DNA adenine methylase [Desertifilum sp. FACHB-1129]|uniref:Site-specific DNA-methyltransferase (adenine-specific) n=1 Tax=Desertifilum tharense IPPAS B-1220 TaxID=1781255 RepID=A0A1E5QKC6_9CYAN|nr:MULTISPECIES: DNA adenine methylase [Desertifilum]MDA0211836.1 DNA adenine methylase [Cyanobacteria bacterium FC1]MBD2312065.1 DNA adenine methylase [Desertifilum sp. FACHB-1129]MBD2322518.1 DNA adenine methylase [Desertifilum sp. FACHB-866]MBD2332681.1 DNA adenine methylase [Desertifilum sp. FACHB-868]OEJ75037.1 DNA methyltransferase [Desertifilum tharense IPPAS B-1220]